MRLFSLILVTAIIGVAGLTACNSKDQANSAATSPTVTKPLPPGDSTRRITPVELKDLLERNQAIVIDVRGEGSYRLGHIKGARAIPATEILQHLSEMPGDKLIVTYCS